jgi:hypothetical protein
VTAEETAAAAPARPTPLLALALLGGAVVLIAGFLGLCFALHIVEYYPGFLFLLCWSALEQGKLAKLPNAVLGSAFGLALGYGLKFCTSGALGSYGGFVFGAIVLPVIYFQLMGWCTRVVNFTAMTFLAVITIPYIQQHGDFLNMVWGLALGVVYFGLVLGTAERFASRRQAAAARG